MGDAVSAPTLKWVASLARLCQVAAVHHAVNGDVEQSIVCEARAELAWKHVKRAHGFRPIAMGGAS